MVKSAPVKISRISLAFKALRELGPRQLGLYALYRAGLKTGYFRRKTKPTHHPSVAIHPLLDLPDPDDVLGVIGPEGLSQLKAEADEIVVGRVRLFGGQPVPLNLTPPGELSHWTEYALGKSAFPHLSSPQSPNHQITKSLIFPFPDIKFIWEPARFGWAFTLGRAYHLTGDERYPEAFWRYFETFRQANPVNLGPNWESAQEVALRLIAFTFAVQIFAGSSQSTTRRTSHLARAIAEHAARIPATLFYARAQNNNHLLSEAAGLLTAALALPEHPHAGRWLKLGHKWFHRGLQSQIDVDGTYMQHSTNYHRLMLQLALWVDTITQKCANLTPDAGHLIPDTSHPVPRRTPHSALPKATRWLLALIDPQSGHVPNLGPNDGAYILPLTVLPFADYRPVLQAAARAFLGEPAFDPGPWDEMNLWLCGCAACEERNPTHPASCTPHLAPSTSRSTLHAPHSWAYLRAAHFSDRPGHADQLHLDLWWRGLNIAQDAGTYLYNAAPPWDNALTHTAVHNTVMLDNREQMKPAGRFLYLERAQAEVLNRERVPDGAWERITARHDGYRRQAIIHTRKVTAYQDDRWLIEDLLQLPTGSASRTPHLARLHWLLPDWSFELQNTQYGIKIRSPHGWITLAVSCQPSAVGCQLIRAGELLHGAGEISPTWGWASPTYGVKVPALSFAIIVESELPITLVSEWSFPDA